MARMYNRYIPNGNTYTRVVVDENPPRQHSGQHSGQRAEKHSERHSEQERQHSNTGGRKTQNSRGVGQDLFENLTRPFRFLGGEEKNAGIAGILKGLNLEDIDSGDILLLLIILLLFLDGDNTELVITLGLMLLLGLGDTKKTDQTE